MKTLSTISNVALTTTFAATLGICASLYNAPAVAKSATPAALQGRWIASSSSATNYWDKSNGQFLGNGNSSGQVYDFDRNGNFKYYALIEVRTYSMVTQVRTTYRGTVNFSGNTFRLRVASGHYHTETGSRISDRDMRASELAKASKTFPWRLEKGRDGKPHFIIPFSDGSKHDFTPSTRR